MNERGERRSSFNQKNLSKEVLGLVPSIRGGRWGLTHNNLITAFHHHRLHDHLACVPGRLAVTLPAPMRLVVFSSYDPGVPGVCKHSGYGLQDLSGVSVDIGAWIFVGNDGG